MPTLKDILIRTNLLPGDLGYIIYLHGKLYKEEYQYGIEFEAYVASGLLEFQHQYDPEIDRVWVCEHDERVVGFLLLMHRERSQAQLRYFLIQPEYRGMGLGKTMMGLFINFLRDHHYQSAYLWTTSELQTAASLYTRHGFVLSEEKLTDAFGKEVTEQRYDLFLPEPNK